MKKLISLLLALVMVMSLTACGGNASNEGGNAAEVAPLTGTMEELVGQIVEKNPVEFMGGIIPVDLADTSEDGLWAVKYYTGLDSAEKVSDVAVYEPMMGSIPFSMVLVRTEDAANVAAAMKAGIDQRKWICVEADDLMVVGYGDVVMLIMVGSDTGMTAQSLVDAFQAVCAAQAEGAEVTVY